MLLRQPPFQHLVFTGDICVSTQVVAKGNRPNPPRSAHRNEVKVMGSKTWRRLAEPVLEFGLVRRIAVAQPSRCSYRRARAFERLHTGHDVDHRLCGKARDGSAADVLNRPRKPCRQRSPKDISFLLEPHRPGRVVWNDLDRRFRQAFLLPGRLVALRITAFSAMRAFTSFRTRAAGNGLAA